MTIRTAAVLGAGTMGSQIAAHLANAGVPTLLLDVTTDAARQGLEQLRELYADAPEMVKVALERALPALKSQALEAQASQT